MTLIICIVFKLNLRPLNSSGLFEAIELIRLAVLLNIGHIAYQFCLKKYFQFVTCGTHFGFTSLSLSGIDDSLPGSIKGQILRNYVGHASKTTTILHLPALAATHSW
jgi:hypothetical protein